MKKQKEKQVTSKYPNLTLFFFSLSATTVSSLSKMCITYSFFMTTNLPWLQKKLSPVLKIVVVAKSSEVTRFFSTAVHFELREL